MKSLFLAGLIPFSAFCSPEFSSYWYDGKAEVSVYDLEQTRYGELRRGTVSLIYVTEPFSKKKQVKLDRPELAEADRLTVLKLNAVKKYQTGLYPYSVMTSSFSELHSGALLKATTSIQEWCGHTFTQANRRGPHYEVHGYSYFESEGDQRYQLREARLEEELWLQLRLDPAKIVEGAQTIVASQEFWRTHLARPQGEPAVVTWEEDPADPSRRTLHLTSKTPFDRRLSITQEKAFPYAITGWTERTVRQGSVVRVKATLKTRHKVAYWEKNRPQDTALRSEYGLE